MSVASRIITFTGPTSDDTGSPVSRRCVRVQQDNSKRTQCPGGATDVLKMLKRLAGIGISSSGNPDDQRQFDGVFRVPIESQDDGQGHDISISYGKLGDPVEETKRYSQTVFTTPASWTAAAEDVFIDLVNKLKHRPETIVSARIVGDARDKTGKQIGAALMIDGSKLYTMQACHAQIAVSYDAYVTTRLAEITPRDGENDNENYYQSSLTVLSPCGGLEKVAIEVPQCFEDFWDTWRDNLKDYINNLNAMLNPRPIGNVNLMAYDKDEAGGGDQNLKWGYCDRHLLLSDSAGVYDELAKQGKVCYPGVLCGSGNSCLPAGEEEQQ